MRPTSSYCSLRGQIYGIAFSIHVCAGGSATRRMTIGDRAFPVAGALVWNALPSFVTDSATVAIFKRHLKTYLFAMSLS